MISAARIQVPKSLPEAKKAAVVELVRVYDNILRAHGISMLWWSIDDYDDRYAFMAHCPGDFTYEVIRAREFILNEYDGVILNGLSVRQTTNDGSDSA